MPIYSTALLNLARLDGRWDQVAVLGAVTCAPGAVTFSAGATRVDSNLCGAPRYSGAISPAGPGRLAVGGAAWWVLWVDTDYRTMVVGTPSGSFGFILNRGGVVPPDRLAAARQVLQFNGYDLTRLTLLR